MNYIFYYNLTLNLNVFYATKIERGSVKQCNEFRMHRHFEKEQSMNTLLTLSKEDFYEVLIASRKNNKRICALKT